MAASHALSEAATKAEKRPNSNKGNGKSNSINGRQLHSRGNNSAMAATTATTHRTSSAESLSHTPSCNSHAHNFSLVVSLSRPCLFPDQFLRAIFSSNRGHTHTYTHTATTSGVVGRGEIERKEKRGSEQPRGPSVCDGGREKAGTRNHTYIQGRTTYFVYTHHVLMCT